MIALICISIINSILKEIEERMSTNNPFKTLGKLSAKSFNDQKALIKKVLSGRTVICKHCQQTLFFIEPNEDQPAVIRCQKGCTDIQLDVVL